MGILACKFFKANTTFICFHGRRFSVLIQFFSIWVIFGWRSSSKSGNKRLAVPAAVVVNLSHVSRFDIAIVRKTLHGITHSDRVIKRCFGLLIACIQGFNGWSYGLDSVVVIPIQHFSNLSINNLGWTVKRIIVKSLSC
jgi:hypothetical protein